MDQNETESFFFEQTSDRKRERRRKKSPEELPQDLRFAHLNPRVAAFLANKEKENSKEDGFDDGLGNKSLLPQINQTVSMLRQKLDSFLNEQDSQRYHFEEQKLSADGILLQLGRQLYYFEGTQPSIPRSLEHELMSQYKDLVNAAQHVHRDWQLLSNKEAYMKKLAQNDAQRFQEERDNRSETAGSAGLDEDGRDSVDAKLGRAKSKLTSRTNTTLADISELEGGKTKDRVKIADGTIPQILATKAESKERGMHKAKSRLDKFKGSSHYDPKGE